MISFSTDKLRKKNPVLNQWEICFLFRLLKLRKIHGQNCWIELVKTSHEFVNYSIYLVYHKFVSSWHVILLLSSKPLNLARRKWSLGYNRYGLQGPDVHQDGLARVQILELWQNNIWIILWNLTKKCLKRRKRIPPKFD